MCKYNSVKIKAKHHTIKAYVGMEIYLHAFLNLTLDGDESEFHALVAFSQREHFVMMYCLSVDCEQGNHR
jgi:hypothetical protein